MSTTGRAGSPASMPGNIVPGDGSALSASPPPPPPPTDPYPKPQFHTPFRVGGIPVATVATGPSSVRLFVHPPAFPRADLISQALAAAQVMPQVFPVSGPIPGPWKFKSTAPTLTNYQSVTPEPPPPPADQVIGQHFNTQTVVSGPWNSFRPPAPKPLPVYPPSPPPPGVPPNPTSPFGPSRYEVQAVPRAPKTADERVRAHIDKVADMFDSWLRAGYVRMADDGEYEIVGGGRALPRAPTADDDKTVGVRVGMVFVNTLDYSVYVNVVNATASAVWVRVSQT